MKEIDFVHLSDTHLGYRQYGLDERFEDWGRATRQVIDYAVDHDVDAVIHSGDLFNSAKPCWDALLQATQIFEPLKERGIPLLVIKGNHDKGREKQRCGAIDVLDRLNYCELLDPSGKDISGAVYKLNGYNFVGLGYPGTDLEGWIDDLSRKLPENRDNVALLHAGVEGHFERWAPHITLEELKKLKEKIIYLALGHSHGSFRLDNWALNPGSIERGKIELRQSPKIFFHVEMEGRNVSASEIEINTRETHYFKIIAENSWDGVVEQCEEKARGADLEETMVRVDVRGELESEFRKGELEEIFKGKPLVLNISDETLSEEKRSRQGIKRRARESAIDTLEAALKARGVEGNEIDEAIHGSGINIEEALERSGEKGSGVSTVSGKPLLELLDFGALSDEDFQEFKRTLMNLLAEGEQKVIDKSEFDEHIDKGWRYVDSVDEERAIVEKQPFQHPDKTKRPTVQNS